MILLLVLLISISIANSAILVQKDIEQVASNNASNTLRIFNDADGNVKFLANLVDGNEEENRELVKMMDIKNIIPASNEPVTEKVREKPRKRFNFYAKRFNNKRRHNDHKINHETERKNVGFVLPEKFVKIMGYSNEEKQDQKEFLFVRNQNIINTNDFVQEDDQVLNKRRRKRSSNIIEEENLGTTVSMLKYTGRDTRLTNELYFKNINQ